MSVISSGRLYGEMRRVADVTHDVRTRMFAMLNDYFHQADRARFEKDLNEKHWCVLLRSRETNQLQGFSTLQHLEAKVGGQRITAIFSGDTIIERAYWGSAELIRIWAEHVFRLAQMLPDTTVYWFLITSGYRTYRFLPVFFREFYPTHAEPTPTLDQQRIEALARLKFPHEYHTEEGIIRLSHPTPLRDGVSDLTPGRMKDPHIAFFVQANPGYLQGEELPCLTRIDYANLTRAGRRLFASTFAQSGRIPLPQDNATDEQMFGADNLESTT